MKDWLLPTLAMSAIQIPGQIIADKKAKKEAAAQQKAADIQNMEADAAAHRTSQSANTIL